MDLGLDPVTVLTMKVLFCFHVAEFCLQFIFVIHFCFEDVIFNVPLGCFETGPVLELIAFVLFLQALLYLWNNPMFGVGIFLNFSGLNGRVYA